MRGVKLLVLLAGAALLAGCGLPDEYYIQPPVSLGTAGGTGDLFRFSNPDHTKDSNINFKGYELYYQFYPNLGSINVNAYDPNSTVDVVSQLINNGFWPVVSNADSWGTRTVPVIPIDPADIAASFEIHVNFRAGAPSDSNFSSPSAITLPSDIFLRRDVQDPDLVDYKTYFRNQTQLGNYVSSDRDIGTVPIGAVYLAMYALSYGLVGISTPQRSIAIYLGYLTLQID